MQHQYIFAYIYNSEGDAFTDTETYLCHRPLTRRSGCVCVLCVCVCVCMWPRIEHSAKHSALSVRNVLLFYYIFYLCVSVFSVYWMQIQTSNVVTLGHCTVLIWAWVLYVHLIATCLIYLYISINICL